MRKKYIIYGRVPTGEAVYHQLLNMNKEVVCFCDDSLVERKHNNSEIPVYSLDEIVSQGISGIFVICIAGYQHIIYKLQQRNYCDWVLAKDVLAGVSPEDFSYTSMGRLMALRQVEACLAEQETVNKTGYLFIRSIDFMITERCSMKCRDCSNLMQYYREPQNFSASEIKLWLEKFTKYVDEICEVRLIGGEPFMNKQIDDITQIFIDEPKIKFITFYSNGTIMPSEKTWEIISNPKVGFSLTDYGDKSKNLAKILCEIKERGIAYDVHPCGKWTKCSDIFPRRRNEEQLKQVYDECCGKNLTTLLKGRLYKCPFMANAMNLRAIPYNDNDCINPDKLAYCSTQDAKAKIKEYLNRGIYASCDYCSGRGYGDVEIEAAIQTPSPLPYKEV